MNEIVTISRLIGIISILISIIWFFAILYRTQVKSYIEGYEDGKKNNMQKYTVKDL